MKEVVTFYKGWVRPDEDAGSLRFAQILQALETRYVTDLQMNWVNATDLAASRHPQTLRKFFGGMIVPDQWRGVWQALYGRPYALCWLSFWDTAAWMTPIVRQALPWAPVVIDTVDVHFVREAGACQLGLLDPATVAKNKRQEMAAYQAADAVVVVTAEDARVLREAGLQVPIHVIPLIIPDRARTDRTRERELVFVGGFRHQPNVDAILWFVRHCWERVRAGVPAARLTVVGSQPPEPVRALGEVDGIEVTGHVPDTAPFLDRAAVSVAPLRFGSGLKGKVCEAMAAGVPVVTTSFGVQGLPALPSEDLCVADDAEDFVDAVVWALTHLDAAEAMGSRGRRVISDLCGPEVVSRKVLELAAGLANSPTGVQLAAWWVRRSLFKAFAGVRRALQLTGVLRLHHLLRGH